MQKNIIISLILSIFWSCAGSNATSMEYRSATTAVRSEKNFEKGEKFALEALDLEVHINEARVAYFLAVEIYRPRKNWEAMDSMLNLAMEKNPTESLERVIRLDDGTILKTIADAVPIYKEEVWRNAFNQTVNLIDAQKFAEALDKINFAKSIIEKADNYITSALINIQLGQDNKYDENYINSAKNDLNKALELDSNNYRALQILGDLEFQERAFDRARGHYEKALQSTESESNINELKQSLIYIHLELEEYEEAINLSNQILDNNTDNADIYFNVGVIYQRLSNTFYEQMIQDYKNITGTEDISEQEIKAIYENCKETLGMVKLAREYFMEASMVEIDANKGDQTQNAINDMKRLQKNIEDVYMISIEKIAKENNIIIN